jgi:SAM-dependent methyltransferase
MKRFLMDLLICPGCLPEESPLSCRVDGSDAVEILAGQLACCRCNARYPIVEGIARLIPGQPAATTPRVARYEKPGMVSSYLWSHFADLTLDPDAGTAYRRWAELLPEPGGFALDAGCAVGRFTFEMARKAEWAVGVDTSLAFIQSARRIMLDRRLETDIPAEGLLTESLRLALPEDWDTERVEFLVADGLALPFRSALFTMAATLNLVDKIPDPLGHLKELGRVTREAGAHLLFSDPFSWSEESASRKAWLGGTDEGPFAGRGVHHVRDLLEGKNGHLRPPWNIDREGSVWWKIRNHVNHFELIRSCYIKASR